MRTIEINVTQEDIDNGERGNPYYCPAIDAYDREEGMEPFTFTLEIPFAPSHESTGRAKSEPLPKAYLASGTLTGVLPVVRSGLAHYVP